MQQRTHTDPDHELERTGDELEERIERLDDEIGERGLKSEAPEFEEGSVAFTHHAVAI